MCPRCAGLRSRITGNGRRGLPIQPCLADVRRALLVLEFSLKSSGIFGATNVRDTRKKNWGRLAAIFGALVCATAIHAQPGREDRWGWNFCPPPYPPACAEAPSGGAAATKACAKEVERYIASVYAYRTCHARELMRAIAEANRVSGAFKCRTDRKSCDAVKETDSNHGDAP